MTLPNPDESRLLGRRLIALLIDWVLFIAIFIFYNWNIAPILENLTADDRPSRTFAEALNSSIAALFTVLFWASVLVTMIWGGLLEGLWGQTPGKVAMGLKVVSADDHSQTIGIIRGIVREIIRAIPFLVGFLTAQETIGPAFVLFLACWPINHLWALWDRERQTLHDKIANSHVISKEPKIMNNKIMNKIYKILQKIGLGSLI